MFSSVLSKIILRIETELNPIFFEILASFLNFAIQTKKLK